MAIIDKDTFSQLVKRPHAVGTDVIPQLEATIKAFPFCQISYSLLAKASSLTSAEKLDETRPRAAAYALSRVALQQLVENDTERYDASVNIEEVIEAQDKAIPQNGEDILISDILISIVEQEITPQQSQKSEEQRRQQQIIEGFMKKNPRIQRQDNNLEPVSIDLSGRVAESGSGSIETEAFAKILIRQGKIEKAIDLYQKLILKKPEKRNYFAKKLSELNHGIY
jgi:tetratricopeptide (TPR) repeat protein